MRIIIYIFNDLMTDKVTSGALVPKRIRGNGRSATTSAALSQKRRARNGMRSARLHLTSPLPTCASSCHLH